MRWIAWWADHRSLKANKNFVKLFLFYYNLWQTRQINDWRILNKKKCETRNTTNYHNDPSSRHSSPLYTRTIGRDHFQWTHLRCSKYFLAWSSLSRYSRCHILPSPEKVAGKEKFWNVWRSRQFARIRKIWDKSCPLWVQSTWLCAIHMAKSAC